MSFFVNMMNSVSIFIKKNELDEMAIYIREN